MAEAESPTAPEPRALLAIDRSAQLCARAFPYLIWRYGAAGFDALRDDNAMLMTTALSRPDALADQVEWIRGQIARRGLPSWMLEVDLECMARTAARAFPDLPRLSEALRRAGEELAVRRRSALSEGKFRRNAADFEAALGFDSCAQLWRGFGGVLTSAVVDERRGDLQIVVRVCAWAMDERRFGAPWRGAVEDCVQAARRM